MTTCWRSIHERPAGKTRRENYSLRHHLAVTCRISPTPEVVVVTSPYPRATMGIVDAERARQRSEQVLDKKHYKKLLKVMNSVEKDLGAKLSAVPSKFVVLSNAGLANGATTSAILNALPESCQEVRTSKHLSHGDESSSTLPCQPVLLPDKPYSFLRCATVTVAEQVVTSLSGKRCFSFLGDQPVYAGYIDRDIAAPDLCFGPLPSGLMILENRITPEEETEWLAQLFSSPCNSTIPVDNATAFAGNIRADQSATAASLKHRQVEHFGYNFDYSINGVRRDQPLRDKPLPPLCSKFAQSLHREGLLSEEHLPDQLTVNSYPPGAGIPAHCDTHSMFTSCIVIVSLLGDTVMEFRRAPDEAAQSAVSVIVPRGSVMFLADESRYGWTHCIVPRKYDLIPGAASCLPPIAVPRAERVSFTFRRVRSAENPCECLFPSLCDSRLPKNPPAELSLADREASKLEEIHVHEVYDDIAKHFSGTRYSQWPRVADFLHRLPRGSLVADVGCGNGKNMRVEGRSDLVFIGSDRSGGLLDICRQRRLEAAQVDCLQQPFRACVFDAAICIAVLHHLANPERRQEGLRQLLQLVRPGGRVLIYVWAKEQRYTGSQSKYLKESSGAKTTRAYPKKQPNAAGCRSSESTDDKRTDESTTRCASTAHEDASRHPTVASSLSPKELADSGKLPAEFGPAGKSTKFVQVGDAKLSIPVHTNRSDFTAGTDILVPWTKVSEGQVKHRFYHVFREGELRSLVELIADQQGRPQSAVTIENEYYDEGNWCLVLVKR